MHASIYVYMNVCMYVCMYGCMYCLFSLVSFVFIGLRLYARLCIIPIFFIPMNILGHILSWQRNFLKFIIIKTFL